jgi:ribosomal protein S18 acetylase RimI-like enzyme
MIEVCIADLNHPDHAQAVVQLLHEYALDPTGGGQGLSDYAKTNLIAELSSRETAHVILALVDQKPAGLTICLEGFSTFACQPLLNIHDVIVTQSQRGQGISKLMLHQAEAIAISLGCCKLTLEVLENNHIAQAAYQAYGFHNYELNPKLGKALFWEKKLPVPAATS